MQANSRQGGPLIVRAGKSTLPTTLVSTHQAILISEDIWLMRLFGDRMKTFDDYRADSQRARTVVGPLVIDLLRASQYVVVDYPANTRTSRAWFRSIYETAGADHVLHYADLSDAMCLERIGQRNIERPEGSHQLTQQDFAYVTSFFIRRRRGARPPSLHSPRAWTSRTIPDVATDGTVLQRIGQRRLVVAKQAVRRVCVRSVGHGNVEDLEVAVNRPDGRYRHVLAAIVGHEVALLQLGCRHPTLGGVNRLCRRNDPA